ncbi:MAG TPA: N-acetyl-1-D-myo-inositol-2-amino-2-deoxy-alpha-D-glucopyranoside deacetylase [Actinocrinis sp.]|uniref:N-acetyl-1-D-myo-inositol-2-amino-2-deoxy-alpha- D-glucopyranoside deacetylase n=1 Tax=Actinocrinis sp. TaxID=1920516 RepID=UPI002DDC9C2D|nr:N-acetyl-1-D-myo-inositol-2-amino-2-deoxy-alpha-D-glucopyranoside deacetylase [Actinocrinis sp.]HEV2345394.1 N-acetyl-1-D-myo-inositol-2-amino-2-deoxy-alpha-D-glucopyranoside deacetylase [Actinocrinis sp.]
MSHGTSVLPRSGQSILFVHAHPDDESIDNGATMAKYAAEGARVTLVTCTLGELGEVIPPELAHLVAGREDRLGPHRITELAAALRELGVTDHRFLGGPGRFRDSGMMGTADNDAPRSFWRADVDVAAALLVPVIRQVRPQVLVTYNEFGGYGHPDHIQAHRVAMRATELAADPQFTPAIGSDADAAEPYEIAKIYWNTLPRSVIEAGVEALRATGGTTGFSTVESVDDLPFVADDSTVTAIVHAEEYVERKAAALRAHATQITVSGSFFALSNHLGRQVMPVEHYQLAHGGPGPDKPETDLFAGLAV